MSKIRTTTHGFSLIELLIALVIAAILASIAWPAYQNQVFRGRRSDAISALAVVAQAQERWRNDNTTYQADLASLPGAITQSQGGHYDITIVTNSTSRNTYTLRATAKSSSPQSHDSNCQRMDMALVQGQFTYTSASSTGTNATPDPCWPQ
jgi:type IV pilus assembly protein PilE